MVSINGVAIVTPSSFNVSIEDISNAERNAAGTLIIDRIATKRKLELAYASIDGSDLSGLLAAVSGLTFTVEYPDPQTGAARTGTFYCGSRKVGMYRHNNGSPIWKDVTFNLIEV